VRQPFEGIRVIDATHVLAGPFATYQLAVLGADVIKIDDPNELDTCRVVGTDASLNEAGMGTFFMTQASNKRSIALDLKSEADRATLRKLVATADVFVENYRPGAFDELDLGYDDLSAIHEGLIYASFSAFGSSPGDRRTQTAYDQVIQASSGLMAMTGTPDSSPMKCGAPIIDYATGLCGAFAIASALFQRTQTGRGQRIDMAMMDVALILMSSHISGYTLSGIHPQAIGNRSESPTNSAFATKSGLVMLGAANRRQQQRLWSLLGHEEIVDDATPAPDRSHERQVELLEEIMPTRTADEWEAYLQANRVPAARVRTMAEALSDPYVRSRPTLADQTVDGADRPFLVPVAAFGYAEGGPRVTAPPPKVGQHTEEILEELAQLS
jgi:crotonobetainyl-CoA:carnitine CoA-transferase CaiB-like acyl-CoA transferase